MPWNRQLFGVHVTIADAEVNCTDHLSHSHAVQFLSSWTSHTEVEMFVFGEDVEVF